MWQVSEVYLQYQLIRIIVVLGRRLRLSWKLFSLCLCLCALKDICWVMGRTFETAPFMTIMRSAFHCLGTHVRPGSGKPSLRTCLARASKWTCWVLFAPNFYKWNCSYRNPWRAGVRQCLISAGGTGMQDKFLSICGNYVRTSSTHQWEKHLTFLLPAITHTNASWGSYSL